MIRAALAIGAALVGSGVLHGDGYGIVAEPFEEPSTSHGGTYGIVQTGRGLDYLAVLDTAAQLEGTPSDLSISRASVTWTENDSGEYTQSTANNVSVQSLGVDAWLATTNYATYSLDASTWSTDGTNPVITVNDDAGPFSTYAGGAECDKINDDSAAAVKYAYRTKTSPATGDWTVSAFVKYGTFASPAISLNPVGGTGIVVCTFTGIDNLATATPCANGKIICRGGAACTGSNGFGPESDYARLVVTSTVGGAPTVLAGGFYPAGNTAANTGANYICGLQIEKASYPTRPCLETAGAASATCAADVLTVGTSAWPTSQGSARILYTPGENVGAYTRYIFDSVSANNGIAAYIDSSNQLNFVTGNGTATTTTTSAALTWTRGTGYYLDMRWNGGNTYVYRNGTSVATGSSKNMPSAHAASAGVCATAAGASQCNGRVHRLGLFQ